MKFAYADPPYLGCGKSHYGEHHAQAEDWDDPARHRQLLNQLLGEYPDGWALSLHTPSLQWYLSTLEEMGITDNFRVGAWVKPWASFKPNVGVAYAWEPVIFKGGRKRTREQNTARDWVSANITMKKGLCGAKPEQFAFWIFEMMNLERSDEFVDLFPGTGAMGNHFKEWLEMIEFRNERIGQATQVNLA